VRSVERHPKKRSKRGSWVQQRAQEVTTEEVKKIVCIVVARRHQAHCIQKSTEHNNYRHAGTATNSGTTRNSPAKTLTKLTNKTTTKTPLLKLPTKTPYQNSLLKPPLLKLPY
jgi:hypothetical protein